MRVVPHSLPIAYVPHQEAVVSGAGTAPIMLPAQPGFVYDLSDLTLIAHYQIV